MSDESSAESQFANLRARLNMLEINAKVKAQRLDALDAKIADLEAKTEPLQEVTNDLAEFRERLDRLHEDLYPRVIALEERLDAMNGALIPLPGSMSLKERVAAMEKRLDTLFGDGGVAAFVEDRIKVALGVIDARLDAMDKMGKVGQ